MVEKGVKNFTFIDRKPVDILASGDVQDVPWIYTAVKDEGLGPASCKILWMRSRIYMKTAITSKYFSENEIYIFQYLLLIQHS